MKDLKFDERDYYIGTRKCHYAYRPGDETLPPILFLHGVTTFGHYFDEVVRHLSIDNPLYLMDFRGHGQSDPVDELYTINSYRDDIIHFVETIDQQVHVVGHSLGGRVGIALAAARPERVVSLTIIDVAPSVDPRGFNRLHQAIQQIPRPFKNQDHVYEYFQTTWGGATPLFIQLMLRYGMIPHEDGTLSPRFDPRIFTLPPEVLFFEAEDLWNCCLRIQAPVLIVRGEFSDVLSPDIARRLQQALPGSQYVEIEGSSHSVPADAPEALARILNRFIRSVDGKKEDSSS